MDGSGRMLPLKDVAATIIKTFKKNFICNRLVKFQSLILNLMNLMEWIRHPTVQIINWEDA